MKPLLSGCEGRRDVSIKYYIGRMAPPIFICSVCPKSADWLADWHCYILKIFCTVPSLHCSSLHCPSLHYPSVTCLPTLHCFALHSFLPTLCIWLSSLYVEVEIF